MISPMATTDELSDKSRFPYFARLVPPDKFQAEAMVDIAVYFNWTYVSLVYSEGPYEENGGKNIEKQIKRKGLCREVSFMISSEMEDSSSSYEEVVSRLLRHSKAKVVFVFMKEPFLTRFLDAVETHGMPEHFIFIFSDSAIRTEHKAMSSGFIINHIYKESKSFTDYYLSLTPFNNNDNPWMKLFWEFLYKCTWENSSADSNCHQYENKTKYQYVGPYVSKTMDSTMVLGLGLHDLLSTKCPEVFQNKTLLKACITGQDYTDFIKNVSIEGLSGTIKFNQQGDMLGAYSLQQIFYNPTLDDYEYIDAGYWGKVNEVLHINNEN